MRVEGTRSFAAEPSVVWNVLNDPAQMAKLMPGVESFEVEDERHWRAKVKVPLGLGGLRLSFRFEKIEERAPEYARLNAKGEGVGAIISMETAFHLAAEGSGTAMRWEADFGIAGPVGSMGQRVLQPIVNQQVSSVLAALERQVSEATTSSTAGSPPSGAGAAEKPPGMAAHPTAARETPPVGSGGGGTAGGATAVDQAGSAETDPELKDVGAPADVTPEADAGAGQEGTSGAEEGRSPWEPESYPEPPDRSG